MNDSPKPQGYGHDAKGRAGGRAVPDGGPNITHTQPIGMVSGEGVGPKTIQFELDGHLVEATAGETIWQVAKRQGREIPHLCYSPEPDYRADGNCRACMVEIIGERVLAPSCMRRPSPGMAGSVGPAPARSPRWMVFELLLADQPPPSAAHDPDSEFWRWAERIGVTSSRFPSR